MSLPNFPLMRSPSTFDLRRAAGSLGLGVGRYNPGDGPKWKVGPDAATKGERSGVGLVDFHAVDRASPVLVSKPEVAAYLNGFAAGLDRGLPAYRLRACLSLALDALNNPDPKPTAYAADLIREAMGLIPQHPAVAGRACATERGAAK